jgi:hypothetical protein
MCVWVFAPSPPFCFPLFSSLHFFPFVLAATHCRAGLWRCTLLSSFIQGHGPPPDTARGGWSYEMFVVVERYQYDVCVQGVSKSWIATTVMLRQ